MIKAIAALTVLAAILGWTGNRVATAQAERTSAPMASEDRPTQDFLRRARAAMGLPDGTPVKTMSVDAARWRSTPEPGAQIGTPSTVLVFPDRCSIRDGLTHVLSGDAFWQIPVPAKGTPPRARHNIARRCAVEALTYALQGFDGFPFHATYIGTWREHGLSGEAVDFRGPDDYRVVMVFDPATLQRLALVEYSELNGIPTPRVSRFEQMTAAPGPLRWPRLLRDTIGQLQLELRVSNVELNAAVDERAFRQP